MSRAVRTRHHRRWTPSETARFMDAWNAGLCWRVLETTFQRTRLAMYEKAHALGLPMRPQGTVTAREAERIAGRAWPALAERYGVTTKRQRASTFAATGHRWLIDAAELEEAADAERERRAGLRTVVAHAKRLKMDPATLRNWLRRAGVLPPARPGHRPHAELPDDAVDRVVRANLTRARHRANAEGAVPMTTARRLTMEAA